MSEERFPSYHHLPPTVSAAQQRPDFVTPVNCTVSCPQTVPPSLISHQLSSYLTEQAAYRNTSYSLKDVAPLQMNVSLNTPIVDRIIRSNKDIRNNMLLPHKSSSSISSLAHAENMSPNFSKSGIDEIDLTDYKSESELYSTNPDKIIKHKTVGDNYFDVAEDVSIQEIKSISNNHYEKELSKLNSNHSKNVVDSSIQIEKDTKNIEQMLEIMFQSNNSEQLSTNKSSKSPSPIMMTAESVENILKSPSPISILNHDDSVPLENSSKTVHCQILEAENKMEQIHSVAHASTSSTNIESHVEEENKLKPIISTKRPNNKNEKKNKKIKKISSELKKPKSTLKPESIVKPKPVNKKFKGPLIRVDGVSIENPTSFVIINRSDQDDNDSLDSCNINRNSKSNKSGMYNGEKKPDESKIESNSSSEWQCVFCLRGPNVRNIGSDSTGDLFGPYFVSIPKEVKKAKQKKFKYNLNDGDTSETFIEVWTHENCLVWTSGIYMVGDKIFGLDEGVRIAKNTLCVYCGVNGASIGCTARHCKSSVHYSCAIHLGWILDSQSFMTTCNIHKNFITGSSLH